MSKIYEIQTNDTPAGILTGDNYTIHFNSIETALQWAHFYKCEHIAVIENGEKTIYKLEDRTK